MKQEYEDDNANDNCFFENSEGTNDLRHGFAFDEAAVVRVEDGVGESLIEKLRAHFLFGLYVIRFRLVVDAEQWGLGDVDVASFHELEHLTVEEREKQGADVRTVDVGIRHDDHAAVAALREVLVLTDAGKAVLTRSAPPVIEVWNDILRDIAPEDIARTIGTLAKILGQLEEREAEAAEA